MSVVESLDKTHYFTVANAFFPLVFPGNHSNPCGIFVIPAENSWKKSPVLPHRNNAILSNSKFFTNFVTNFGDMSNNNILRKIFAKISTDFH